MTADHGDPFKLAALCILVLVIAFGAAARMVLIQSLHTLHDALHPY